MSNWKLGEFGFGIFCTCFCGNFFLSQWKWGFVLPPLKKKKKGICKQPILSPQTCTKPPRSDRERCLLAGRPFSLSLRTSKESPLNNNDSVSECCIKERGRVQGKLGRSAPGVHTHLLSVSQVLIFNVAQRLPVGVAAPAAASLHLRQWLSLHRVTHLVVPVEEKRTEKKHFHNWSEATGSTRV